MIGQSVETSSRLLVIPLRGVRALSQNAFALVDQALFAAATFITAIILARSLNPTEFGAFSLTFLVFLLIGALHTSVLTEPMLVFGATEFRRDFRRYLGFLLYGHGLLALAVTVVLLAISVALWIAGLDTPSGAFAGLAVSSPFMLLLWLLRRAFYVSAEPLRAAAGDALYLTLALVGLFLLLRLGSPTPGLAFLVMGAAALLASAFLLTLLRPQFRALETDVSARHVVANHWSYGKWNVLAQALFWSTGQILVVLIALVLGLSAVAALTAASLLFRPLGPIMQSVAGTLLPSTASLATSCEGHTVIRSQTQRYLLVCASGTLCYGLTATLLAGPILHLLYAGKYDDSAILVAFFALSYTATAVIQIYTLVLKATGNVNAVPFIWILPAVITLFLSVPLMHLAGLRGAMVVLVTSYVLAAFVARRRATVVLHA